MTAETEGRGRVRKGEATKTEGLEKEIWERKCRAAAASQGIHTKPKLSVGFKGKEKITALVKDARQDSKYTKTCVFCNENNSYLSGKP